MGRIITFNVTCIGASHVKNGKPCQDYSLSWQSEDKAVQVAIVCDGHGGSTYVRSDRGSELAAQIALRNIQDAVNRTPADLFLGEEGAVTARPEEEGDIFHPSDIPAADLNYSDDDRDNIHVQRKIQYARFYEAVGTIRKQDAWMQELFARIYLQWLDALEKDVKCNPFTEWEITQLKGAPITKAYGTTLMAFVRTPLYWFAFHIGDGKMLCCDAKFQWREPVPWDCECFLNITTSLCGSEPLHSFRYAFNGKGEFPIAVIMGSDGLDDSWCTMPNLKNFYSQVLCIFNDLKEEETIKEMSDYLPRLSEKGSRDDMSMAGLIDMDAIAAGAAVYKKRREIEAICNDQEKQKQEFVRMEQEIEALRKRIVRLQAELQAEQQKKDSWLMKLLAQEQEIESAQLKLQEGERSLSESVRAMQEKQLAYEEWEQEAKQRKRDLTAELDGLLDACNSYDAEVQACWQQTERDYQLERQASQQRSLQERVANMMAYNDEAARSIHEATFEPEEAEREPDAQPDLPEQESSTDEGNGRE